jgi:hypothetical protein
LLSSARFNIEPLLLGEDGSSNFISRSASFLVSGFSF